MTTEHLISQLCKTLDLVDAKALVDENPFLPVLTRGGFLYFQKSHKLLVAANWHADSTFAGQDRLDGTGVTDRGPIVDMHTLREVKDGDADPGSTCAGEFFCFFLVRLCGFGLTFFVAPL